jgi:hypothetical protein
LKRLLGIALIVAMATLTVALHGAPQIHAQSGGTISVTPGSGTQDDTFVFTGIGFTPGTILAVVYQDPSGTQYTYTLPDGTPDVLTADADGNWILTVYPRTDFAGAYAGTWAVAFCTPSGSCFTGTIDISA